MKTKYWNHWNYTKMLKEIIYIKCKWEKNTKEGKEREKRVELKRQINTNR